MLRRRLCVVATMLLVAGGVDWIGSGVSVPPPGAGEPSVISLAGVAYPQLHRPVRCRGYVSLSFDDGPTPGTTRILSLLKYYRVGALFFNTGLNSARLPDVIAAERATPAVQLGNHSYDHPNLNTLTAAAVNDQISRTQSVLGMSTTFFRPPYGAANRTVLRSLATHRLREVLWTRESKDFDAASVGQVVSQSSGMKDGGILLLHDGHPLTVSALPYILDLYYSRGLCIGKVAASTSPQAPAESPALTFYARAVAP